MYTTDKKQTEDILNTVFVVLAKQQNRQTKVLTLTKLSNSREKPWQ